MSLEHLQEGENNPPLKKGLLRMYNMQYCPYAHRTRLVLEHKKIPHDMVNIHLKNKPSWFIEKNPLGTVPTLELDGKIVWESAICNDFLDELYPNNQLNPKDPYEKARQKIVAERWGNAARLLFILVRKTDQREETKKEILHQFSIFENEIKDKKYFGGDTVGMVDFIVWPHLERLYILNKLGSEYAAFGDYKSRFPAMAAYTERMLQQPAVQATLTPPEIYLKYARNYEIDIYQYDGL